MTTINYTLELSTTLDESHPTAARILSLDEDKRLELLRKAFTDLVADKVDELNANGSWAILKVGA